MRRRAFQRAWERGFRAGRGKDWATSTTVRLVGVPFCPDLLRYEDIGEADNLRGRVVRAFFWLIRWWKP